MLWNQSFVQGEHESIKWLLLRRVWAGEVSLSLLRFACAVSLVCAVTSAGLGAFTGVVDNTPDARMSRPDPGMGDRGEAESSTPAATDAPKKPKNIANSTKEALASEWRKPDEVGHVLKALMLLTSSSLTPSKVNLEVLHELAAGDPSSKDLYRAAMGAPDDSGQPTVQGLPDILETLAKANTLSMKKPEDEDGLFGTVDSLLDTIFEADHGKVALIIINHSFGRKDNYVALYQLLNAFPRWKEDADDTAKDSYVKNLEFFRAAFEMNADRLAKLVASKITSPKE